MLDDETTSEEESQTDGAGTSDGTDETPKAPTEAEIEAFLDSEGGKKALQSEADKRQATYERRMQVDRRDEMARLRQQREDAELMELVDADDTQGLGERAAESLRQRRQLAETAELLSGAQENVLKEHPEFQVLGGVKIDEIFQGVKEKKGSVIDFMLALTNEKQKLAFSPLLEEATEKMGKELDARLVEAGLKKREEEESTDESVSGSTPRKTDATGDDALIERWNEGDPSVTREQVLPILRKRGIEI